MNKKRIIIYASLSICMLLGLQLANAQATPEDLSSALGFDNTVNDVPEAPIHFLVGAFMALGCFLGLQKLKK